MKVIETQLQILKETIHKIKDQFHGELIDILHWFHTFLLYQFTHKENTFFTKQGDVYETNLGRNIGSELNKKRPCVVISDNPFNSGNTVVIIPLKSIKEYTKQGILTVIVEENQSNLEKQSFVSIANIKEVSKRRLHKKIGRLSKNDINKIKNSLTVLFGIQKKSPITELF